VLMGFI